jgi:DNA invertase Pin-like site-specific DNA recombinase
MMSETLENEAIAQALQIIDRHLSTLNNRELVSTSEVSDLLLDMRSVLAAAELEIELERTTASAAN